MKSERRELLLFLLVFAAALTVRLLGLGKGLWLDELTSIEIVTTRTWHEMLGFLRHDLHPPLYFVLLKPWAALGSGEPFLRLFSVALNMIMLALIGIWLRAVSVRAAATGCALAAFLPVMIRFGQEIRPYSLLLLATAFTFCAVARAAAELDRPGYLAAAALRDEAAGAQRALRVDLVLMTSTDEMIMPELVWTRAAIQDDFARLFGAPVGTETLDRVEHIEYPALRSGSAKPSDRL